MQESIWFQSLTDEDRARLGHSDSLPEQTEIAVIGGGLIGLSSAYYLSEAGFRDICVLDQAQIVGEASGANAGGLWFAQQSPELGSVASLARRSSELYDSLAERFPFELRRCGLIELLWENDSLREARQRLDAVLSAGFRAEFLSGDDARTLEPALGVTPAAAIYYPDEGAVNPVRLGLEWVSHLRSRGVRLCPGTEVKRLGRPLQTARGKLEAETIIVACGAWTPLVTAALGWQPPIRPIRGTLVAAARQPKLLRHTLIGGEYYYWQLASGEVAGGGSIDDVGFDRGVEPSTCEHIRKEMDRLLPALSNQQTVCAWSGFRPFCEDLKPVIGPVPGQKRMFVAAGHFKKGVMMAPVTGYLLAQLATGAVPDLDLSPLEPGRFPWEAERTRPVVSVND